MPGISDPLPPISPHLQIQCSAPLALQSHRSVASAPSPRVLSGFYPLPWQGLRRACQAGVSLRLHEASETELPAALRAACPLIGRGCCFHGDPWQSPPSRPPHRPYSVARAATGRLIKQEPREEPGCGPRSQRGGPPRGERDGGGGEREALAAQSVPAPLQPTEGTLPIAGAVAAPALGDLGLIPWNGLWGQCVLWGRVPFSVSSLGSCNWGWG